MTRKINLLLLLFGASALLHVGAMRGGEGPESPKGPSMEAAPISSLDGGAKNGMEEKTRVDSSKIITKSKPRKVDPFPRLTELRRDEVAAQAIEELLETRIGKIRERNVYDPNTGTYKTAGIEEKVNGEYDKVMQPFEYRAYGRDLELWSRWKRGEGLSSTSASSGGASERRSSVAPCPSRVKLNVAELSSLQFIENQCGDGVLVSKNYQWTARYLFARTQSAVNVAANGGTMLGLAHLAMYTLGSEFFNRPNFKIAIWPCLFSNKALRFSVGILALSFLANKLCQGSMKSYVEGMKGEGWTLSSCPSHLEFTTTQTADDIKNLLTGSNYEGVANDVTSRQYKRIQQQFLARATDSVLGPILTKLRTPFNTASGIK